MRPPRLFLLLGVYGAGAAALLLALPPRHDPAALRFATYRGEAMSTAIAVTLPATAESPAAAAAVFDLFARLEQDLSEWRPGSPLATVNERAGGAPVAVPPDLLALVDRSLALGERTDGAFDPSWAALWGVWDFRAAAPRLPEPAEIAQRRALVGWQRVELDREAGTLRLPEPI